MNLHVHLHGSYTFWRTSYFKVHVACKVLGILNVGQNNDVIAVNYKAHSYTANWCF